MITVLLILIAYVLGSIPNALWVGKTFKNIDVREHGSKNTGSTNAARVLGPKLGIFTLILDILKGALPTYLGIVLGANLLTRITGIDKLDIIVIGMAAILGHTFSLFLKFKGGKAVATTLGVFLVLVPYAILILLVVFFVIFGLTKYVSLASIVSAVALPITVYLTTRHIPLTILGIIIGLLVIIRHKENIKRLINGTESKLSFSKDKKDKK
ncbi:MAG: glycerol-3-phosphate 1-O-acyltransferase PlsY [Leptotrichiaceae bacterium]